MRYLLLDYGLVDGNVVYAERIYDGGRIVEERFEAAKNEIVMCANSSNSLISSYFKLIHFIDTITWRRRDRRRCTSLPWTRLPRSSSTFLQLFPFPLVLFVSIYCAYLLRLFHSLSESLSLSSACTWPCHTHWILPHLSCAAPALAASSRTNRFP